MGTYKVSAHTWDKCNIVDVVPSYPAHIPPRLLSQWLSILPYQCNYRCGFDCHNMWGDCYCAWTLHCINYNTICAHHCTHTLHYSWVTLQCLRACQTDCKTKRGMEIYTQFIYRPMCAGILEMKIILLCRKCTIQLSCQVDQLEHIVTQLYIHSYMQMHINPHM